ncbi:MAG TPA: 4'-phosphopantetheinyl transferase superfamily protein, partial [Moraxellaceae bacterium]
MTTAYIAWLQDDGSAVDSSLLLPAEQAELAGFRSPERQRSFLLSRLLLRKLLRPHLPSSSLIFKRAESGRLFLEEAQGWHFSLSHSAGGIAAIACTQPCGIDIEVPRKASFESVASRYFAEAEKKALQEAPTDQRVELFFRLWTLKEASVKALGEGL